MTPDPFAAVQRIADAVMWEGYVLYPYRADSPKNQVRWQYGVLTPRAYSEADGHERWRVQTECLVDLGAGSDDGRRRTACVDVRLRFLQVQARTVERADGASFEPVAELHVGDEVWCSWDEAVEHAVDIAGIDIAGIDIGSPDVTGSDGLAGSAREVRLSLRGGRDVEAIGTVGRVVRERWPVEAVARVSAQRCRGPYPLVRLCVALENTTDWASTTSPRAEAMRRSLVAVHTLLHGSGAHFVSLLDPPEFARSAAATCANDGTFPVVVGDAIRPRTVLSSPIILYDHPTVAPQSQGDMYDGLEIDEILALRVLTLSDDEKRAARGTDPRAAAIVDRVEQFSPEVFADLHGEMRPVAKGTSWWEPEADAAADPFRQAIVIAGERVTRGCRVRLQPGATGRRTDAQDLFLDGRAATVEGVFLDVDGDEHVAVTVDDDPVRDLHRDAGRYLFFHPDEVTPL